jgi:hypothetical protein
MSTITSTLRRDGNYVPLQDVNGISVINSKTFSNSTGTITLFTVTGDVILRVFGICKTDLASAGACNIVLGVAGTTNKFIASTNVTTLVANEIWNDATPTTTIELDSSVVSYIISGSQNVILTLSAQIDSGAMDFYCQWRPLSSDADVIAS